MPPSEASTRLAISELRCSDLAAIELVAADEATIVGHILFSTLPVTVEERPVRALALAPMLSAPIRGEPFMALELMAGALAGHGRVTYPASFGLSSTAA